MGLSEGSKKEELALPQASQLLKPPVPPAASPDTPDSARRAALSSPDRKGEFRKE